MTDCGALIDAMRRDFSVELVTSADTLLEAQRLRYQVYCSERHHQVGHDGIESDEFDGHAHHIVLRHRISGELVGNVRLVTASKEHPKLPMHGYCSPGVFHGLFLATTGEVSRFALSRTRRSSCGKSDLLLRLGLMQGVLRASRQLGLTHWCATMEPSLLRLLRTAAVHFKPVGPLVDLYGQRQPAVGDIDALLINGRRERPAIWDYVTDFGELAPEARLLAA
ncbi:MAG: GNAT family N-acyltransferase [Acetobacteraceae bacterium]